MKKKPIKMGRLVETENTRPIGNASKTYWQTVLEKPPYGDAAEFGVLFTEAEIMNAQVRFNRNMEDEIKRTAGQDSRD